MQHPSLGFAPFELVYWSEVQRFLELEEGRFDPQGAALHNQLCQQAAKHPQLLALIHDVRHMQKVQLEFPGWHLKRILRCQHFNIQMPWHFSCQHAKGFVRQKDYAAELVDVEALSLSVDLSAKVGRKRAQQQQHCLLISPEPTRTRSWTSLSDFTLVSAKPGRASWAVHSVHKGKHAPASSHPYRWGGWSGGGACPAHWGRNTNLELDQHKGLVQIQIHPPDSFSRKCVSNIQCHRSVTNVP